MAWLACANADSSPSRAMSKDETEGREESPAQRYGYSEAEMESTMQTPDEIKDKNVNLFCGS